MLFFVREGPAIGVNWEAPEAGLERATRSLSDLGEPSQEGAVSAVGAG